MPFVPTVLLSSLTPGKVTAVQVGAARLALYVVDGAPFCTTDVCTHEDWLISDDGWVEGCEVECCRHGARFDVRTGEVTMPPAAAPLRTFAVDVRDGRVYVEVP
jgi:nitrite reductase/ring-hydroxylating ferredoxin subunit